MKPKYLLFAAMLVLAMVSPSLATTVLTPPPGAILDLNGLSSGKGTVEPYTVDFTATAASTSMTFLFRDDNGQLLFTNPSVVDTTASNGNLLLNSSFTGGTYTSGGTAPGRRSTGSMPVRRSRHSWICQRACHEGLRMVGRCGKSRLRHPKPDYCNNGWGHLPGNVLAGGEQFVCHL